MSVTDITRALPPGSAAPAAVDGRLALPVKLFLLSIFLPVAFQLGPLFMNGVRLVLLIVSVPLFFQLLAGRFGKPHLVDYMFFAHVIWMAVALGVNNPDRMVQQVGSVGLEFFGGYLLGRAFIRNRAQFLALCRFVVWGIVLLLPLSLMESQTGRPVIVDFLRSLPGITSYREVNAGTRLGLERVQGTFAHPIHFGLFCSMMLPICFFAFRHSMSNARRLTLTGLVFLSSFLGLSAGVMLAMVAQVGLISWYLALRNVQRKWLVLTLCILTVYLVVDLISTRDPIRVFITYATFSPHTGYWRTIIFDWGWMNIFGSAENNIPPAPLFGIGLNDWVRPSFMHSGSMDNFWLLTGVRYGVPGFLTLAIGYFWTLWQAGQRTDLDGDPELLDIRRAWIFVFAGLTLTLTTVHIWTSIYAYVFFFFGAGVWLLTAQPQGADTGETADMAQADMRARRYSRFPTRSTRRPGPFGAGPAPS
jgi:hypothetical protein